MIITQTREKTEIEGGWKLDQKLLALNILK